MKGEKSAGPDNYPSAEFTQVVADLQLLFGTPNQKANGCSDTSAQSWKRSCVAGNYCPVR